MQAEESVPEGLLEFLKAAGELKRLKRTGWVQREIPDSESVADHSFRAALLAMIIGDARGLDTLKLVKMALLHDVQESKIGDITPIDPEYEGKVARELDVARELSQFLPAHMREEWLSLWLETLEQKTPEAKLVREIDKFEMVLQAHEYVDLGFERAGDLRNLEFTEPVLVALNKLLREKAPDSDKNWPSLPEY